MKLLSLTSVLSFSAVTLATTLVSSSPASSQQATFVCGTSAKGDPATIAQTSKHGNVIIITWNSDHFADSGFDNQTRCDIVSQKFQDFHNQGSLKYFTAGSANKEPIICAVPSMNSPCNSDSQLFTLKRDSDPEAKLRQLFDIRSGESHEGLYENNNVSANDRLYLSFEEVLNNKANQGNEIVQESPSTEPENQEPSTNDDFIF